MARKLSYVFVRNECAGDSTATRVVLPFPHRVLTVAFDGSETAHQIRIIQFETVSELFSKIYISTGQFRRENSCVCNARIN